MMDPVGVITEFDRALRKELDFQNEKRNITQFHRNFADVENVSVPRCYDDVCTSKVLAMDFIHGGEKLPRLKRSLILTPMILLRK